MNIRSSDARTPFRLTLTSAILVALYGVSPFAFAQSAPATPGATDAAPQTSTPGSTNDTQNLGTVVVQGYAASVEKAIELKKDTVGQVDAVVAEDIGKFPDQNLAESLQRIPGVTRVVLLGTSAGGAERAQ